MQQDLSNQFGSSHIITIAAKEIQEAVKDLDITRQVCTCILKIMWENEIYNALMIRMIE